MRMQSCLPTGPLEDVTRKQELPRSLQGFHTSLVIGTLPLLVIGATCEFQALYLSNCMPSVLNIGQPPYKGFEKYNLM